jgi:hypothetical protein
VHWIPKVVGVSDWSFSLKFLLDSLPCVWFGDQVSYFLGLDEYISCLVKGLGWTQFFVWLRGWNGWHFDTINTAIHGPTCHPLVHLIFFLCTPNARDSPWRLSRPTPAPHPALALAVVAPAPALPCFDHHGSAPELRLSRPPWASPLCCPAPATAPTSSLAPVLPCSGRHLPELARARRTWGRAGVYADETEIETETKWVRLVRCFGGISWTHIWGEYGNPGQSRSTHPPIQTRDHLVWTRDMPDHPTNQTHG